MQKTAIFALFLAVANAGYVQEIRVKTAQCSDCGMVPFFGQLSVKVIN